jgi:hypothetical protein
VDPIELNPPPPTTPNEKAMEGLLSFLGPSAYNHVTPCELMNSFSRNVMVKSFTKYCEAFVISLKLQMGHSRQEI